MPITFHCPFDDLLKAAETVAGKDIDCEVVFAETEVDCKGLTLFPDKEGERTQVIIKPEATISQALDVLAHELSHVIVGTAHEDDHGSEFESTYEAIHTEYMRVYEATVKTMSNS